MENADNDEDEDAYSDQCDGRQQYAVAGSKIQLSTPTTDRKAGRQNVKISHMLFYDSLQFDRKPKSSSLAETIKMNEYDYSISKLNTMVRQTSLFLISKDF